MRYFKQSGNLARNVLQELEYSNGYVIAPIILRPLFKSYLDKYSPSKMNIDRGRNLADVFTCLCNEQYIYQDWDSECFFVQRDKWQTEYCIGRKTFENSIKLLKDMGLITYENKWDKKRKTRRRWFKINDCGVRLLTKRAEVTRRILKKQREERVIVDNRW